MNMRKKLDISAYLVVGPENTLGRPVGDIIRAAVENGFTCLQIRSKTASARELIALCREAAAVLKALGKAEDVVLLVDDRLDVVLAAREAGIKVDGIHVGQSDIPVAVCRKFWDLRQSSGCRRARRSCSTTCVRPIPGTSTTLAPARCTRRRQSPIAAAMPRAHHHAQLRRTHGAPCHQPCAGRRRRRRQGARPARPAQDGRRWLLRCQRRGRSRGPSGGRARARGDLEVCTAFVILGRA